MSQQAGRPAGPRALRDTPLSEVMTRELVTVQIGDPTSLVSTLMEHHPIHHLPVLEGRVLRGVISQLDLERHALRALRASEAERLEPWLEALADVPSLMTPDPFTLAPEATVADALRLVLERQVGCVPVVDRKNHLLGLVTATDLLRWFWEAMQQD